MTEKFKNIKKEFYKALHIKPIYYCSCLEEQSCNIKCKDCGLSTKYYPMITDNDLFKLICLYNKYQNGTCCYADNIDELKDNILEKTILACKQDDNYVKAVRKLIKGL